MMKDDLAVFAGTYADIKTIKTRGVVQIVVEVPIEQGEFVVRALGFPQPGKEIRLAVARLVDGASAGGADGQGDARGIAKGHAPSAQKPGVTLSQIAAIKCTDEAFQDFVFKSAKVSAASLNHQQRTHLCATEVRKWCGVESRRDLDKNQEAARAFHALVSAFEAHQMGLSR